MFRIDESVKENAPKLFGHTKETLEKEVENLRNWMESVADRFPEVMNSTMIRNFIVINKFDVEKAKDHMENYYKVRVKYPEFYVNANPKTKRIQIHQQMIHTVQLPTLTEQLDRVTVCKLGNVKLASKYNPVDYFAFILDVFELQLQLDHMVNNVFVIDNGNVPLSFYLRTTPAPCYKITKIVQKVYSFRIRKVYFINMPRYAYFLVNMLKGIMKTKLYERLEICPDESILHEIFPKAMLPSDYGGEEKSMKELATMQMQLFKENSARFDRLDEIQEIITKAAAAEGHNDKHCTIS